MIYTPSIWANGKKPAINASNLNKMEQALVELANIVSVPDITTTDQTTLPNSHAGRFKFDEIGGVCEQESTSGNQLFDMTQGVVKALVYQPDGSQSQVDTVLAHTISVKENIVQTISNEGSGAVRVNALNESGGFIERLVTVTNGEATFTTPSGCKSLQIAWDNTVSNIMLNEGTTALPYEKYTGGIPAPNPSYPMEIKKSVVGRVKTYFAKGLVNPYTCVNGLLNTSGVLTTASTWVTSDYSEVKGGTKISISTKTKVVRFAQYDANKNFIKNTSNIIGVTDSIYTPWTTTLESNTKYVRATFGLETSITPHELFKNHWIQIEEGEPTEFELLKESSYTFSQPIELYGKNGVQDVIDVERGKVVQNIEEYTIPSDISVTVYDDVEGISRFRLNVSPKIMDNDVNLLCEYFSGGYTLTEINRNSLANYCCIYGSELWFTTPRGAYTADAFKEFIVGKKIYYTLATPTETDLPIADQIGLNSLETYDGITYVEFDSEIQPTFKAEYGTSKVGGYTLESLLVARNNELRG